MFTCVECQCLFQPKRTLKQLRLLYNGSRTLLCKRCSKSGSARSRLSRINRDNVLNDKLNLQNIDIVDERRVFPGCRRISLENDSRTRQMSSHSDTESVSSDESSVFENYYCAKVVVHDTDTCSSIESGSSSESESSDEGSDYDEESEVDPPPSPTERPRKTGLRTEKKNASGIDFWNTTNTCLQCGKVFSTSSHLARHERMHSNKHKSKCKICDKVVSNYHLKNHMLTHSDRQALPCTKCDKVFYAQRNLQRHMKTHLDNYSITCSVCQKVFNDKCNFKRHMLIHRGEHKKQCPICNTAISTYNFKKHLLTHSDVSSLKCPDCDAIFTTREELRQHLVSHSDTRTGCARLKLKVCHVCQGAYTNIKKHLLIHTGQHMKPCPICGNKYSHLKKHILTHKNKGSVKL